MKLARIILPLALAAGVAAATTSPADATPRPERKAYVCHRMGAHPVLIHVSTSSTTYRAHAHHRADKIEGRDGDAAAIIALCGAKPEPTATVPTHTPKPTHTRTPCPTHTTVTTPPTSSTTSSTTSAPPTSSTTTTTTTSAPPTSSTTSSSTSTTSSTTTSTTPPTSAAPASSSVAPAPPSTTRQHAAPQPVSTQAAAVAPELAHTGVNGRGMQVLAAIGALLAVLGFAALVLSRRATGSHR